MKVIPIFQKPGKESLINGVVDGQGAGTYNLRAVASMGGTRYPGNVLLSHTPLCTDQVCDQSCPTRVDNGVVRTNKVVNGVR